MKIIVLMSLVSALAFIMLNAQQSKACPPCPDPARPICLAGDCYGRRLVAAPNASKIDSSSCSVFGDNVTCELKSNNVAIPLKAFEAMLGAESVNTTCSPPCGANQICVGGACLPRRNEPSLNPNTCSVFGDNVTCELKSNSVTVPKGGFEALMGAESGTTK
jgi:hypothetical protein